MDVVTVETPCLGNRSYLVVDGRAALVVDPPRDVDRVERVAAEWNARIEVVAETHRHADYVSGGLELARRHRATYAVPPGEPEPYFDHARATEGARFGVGSLCLRTWATPGHTPHHVAYSVEVDGEPLAICTGGSLLYGSVGRTDLSGHGRAADLAREQWTSVRRLAHALPDGVQVLPTHGFGSFCSAGAVGDVTSSTIGRERETNRALIEPREQFSLSLVSGYGAVPRHYARLPQLNAAGPAPFDPSPPPELPSEQLRLARARGHWLVDLRDRREFAAEHLDGAVNVELTGAFAAYLPWLLPAGSGVVLLGDADAVAEAGRQLAFVGIDRPVGVATGTPLDAAGGDESALRSYPVGNVAGLELARSHGALVLDVRSRQEWTESHVDDAINLPLPDLAELFDPAGPPSEWPEEEVWVYCAAGFRAAAAASMLDAAGIRVTLADGSYADAVTAGITVHPARAGDAYLI